MRGLLATLLIVTSLLLASGSMFADGCAVPCADESPGRDCPPDCTFCACCIGARPAILEAGLVVSPLSLRGSLLEDPDSLPAPPLAREILHVPKAA